MIINWQESLQLAQEIVEAIEDANNIHLGEMNGDEAVDAIADLIYDKDRFEWDEKRLRWR